MRIAPRLLSTTTSWCTRLPSLKLNLLRFHTQPMEPVPKDTSRGDAPQKRRRMKRDKSPKYHPQLVEDTSFLAKAFAAGPSRVVERLAILDRVRGVLTACGGGGFDVEDVSMHRYTEDLEFAPVELVLVDMRHPNGFPPDRSSGPLSNFYDPTTVATILLYAGFDGVFPSMEQSRCTENFDTQQIHLPPCIPDESQPWPAYTRTYESEVVYPPILEARSPMTFNLTLPSPTMAHTIRLLAAYKGSQPHFSHLNTLLYTWLRSWGVSEITPITLAILVVKFLQENGYVHLENNNSDDSFSQHVHLMVGMPYRTPNNAETIQLEVSYSMPKEIFPPVQGALIVQFFTWFLDQNFHLPRKTTLPVVRITQPKAPVSKYSKNIEKFNDKCHPWSQHALIVVDPFVSTHNHAFRVNRATLFYTWNAARASLHLLSSGFPLLSIFGPRQLPLPVTGWAALSNVDDTQAAGALGARFSGPRKPASPFQLQRRSYSTDARLKMQARKLYEATIPRPEVHRNRSKTITRINNAIQRKYGSKYRVELFGSTRYGVDHANSDLDLVIVDPDRMTGFSPQVLAEGLPEIYNIWGLEKTLKRAGFRILGSVPRASVPIVKFMDPATGLQCDINVNDQLGLINSALIRHYCDLLPNLRPLIKTIKSWAKPLGLNDPGIRSRETSFSSYALVMMTIGLLQSRGLLPNLHADVDNNPGPHDVFWPRARNNSQYLRVDTRWNKGRLSNMRAVELDELMLDWLKFFGYEYSFRLHAVSVRHGGIVARDKPSPRTPDLQGVVPFSGQPQFPGLFDKIRQQKDKGDKGAPARSDGSQRKAEESESSDEEQPAKSGSSKETFQRDLQPSSNLDDEALEPVDEDENVEDAEEPLEGDDQPSKWSQDAIVVSDPFIRSKNVATSVGYGVLRRFRAECQRAYTGFKYNASLQEILARERLKAAPPPTNPTQRGRPRGRLEQPQQGPSQAVNRLGQQPAQGSSPRMQGSDPPPAKIGSRGAPGPPPPRIGPSTDKAKPPLGRGANISAAGPSTKRPSPPSRARSSPNAAGKPSRGTQNPLKGNAPGRGVRQNAGPPGPPSGGANARRQVNRT